MIGYLKGTILQQENDMIILDVHDVGYRVHVSESVRRHSGKGDNCELFIHTQVKEDCLDLYGFASTQELSLFTLLLTVSGVGPKSALGVLNLGVEQCMNAIQHADTTVFSSVPRLGKKTAQKIIIELQPKLGEFELLELGGGNTDFEQAVQALIGMGYEKQAVLKAAKQLPKETTSIDAMITYLIKTVGT